MLCYLNCHNWNQWIIQGFIFFKWVKMGLTVQKESLLCSIRHMTESITFTVRVASSQHRIKWHWTGGFSYWPASFLTDRKHPANDPIFFILFFFLKGLERRRSMKWETHKLKSNGGVSVRTKWFSRRTKSQLCSSWDLTSAPPVCYVTAAKLTH